MYFLLKMKIFQPVMLVFRGVDEINLNKTCIRGRGRAGSEELVGRSQKSNF